MHKNEIKEFLQRALAVQRIDRVIAARSGDASTSTYEYGVIQTALRKLNKRD